MVCTQDGKYGIISSTGAYVVDAVFLVDDGAAQGYYGGKDTGVFWLFDGSAWAFFDVQSGFLSPFCYHETQDLWFDGVCSQLLRVTYDGRTYGYVDRKNGQLRIPCIFSQINTVGFHHGLTFETLAETGEHIVVQEDGSFVTLAQGLQAVEGEEVEDGRFLAQNVHSGLYGYCDVSGQCLIPAQFEEATSFCNGYAAVRMDGKWGHIDLNGTLQSPCLYDTPYSFCSERAIAYDHGTPTLLDSAGNVLTTLPNQYTYYDFLPQGIALFSDGTYFGMINESGEELLSPTEQYVINIDQASAPLFNDGMQPVMNASGRWGYINIIGSVTIGFDWDAATPFTDGVAYAVAGGKLRLLNTAGEVCWQETE